MAPLPAPAEKPSHRVSDSQSHAKVRPPTQVAVFCAALWPNLQPALTAVDKLGNTIDFYLSATCNTKAAKRFLGKALRGLKEWEQPEVLNTDKAPAYAAAIAELKAEGKCPKDTRHRQVKYLNNVIEADHGKLKLLIRPVRGFKTLKTAYATIKGFELMRALRKGQVGMFALQGGIVGEARIVERAFDIGPCALTEAVALLQDRLANAET